MTAKELIQETFIKPFFGKERQHIGTELEFPLLAADGGAVDLDLMKTLLHHLAKQGFSVAETDADGLGVFLINEDGDCLSFDNSYNNFEFSMEKSKDLVTLSQRFYKLYDLVQSFLLDHSHTLCGMGTNPNHEGASSDPVSYPIYKTLRCFLHQYVKEPYHRYPDFPAWLSSVQTHLDVAPEQLPTALTVFSRLDFARGLLFSNSLPFTDAPDFSDTICFRDYLWENSGFGCLKDNTGPVNGSFKTLDDIIDLFLKKDMFLLPSGKDYQIIAPLSMEDYCEKYGEKHKLSAYLSFKNVEITRRGTLEIRSDCAQPVGSAFLPPAFNLGVLYALPKIKTRLDGFFKELPEAISSAPDCNRLLRQQVINGKPLPVSDDALSSLLTDLVSLAETGLASRGYGEEKLLKPLFARAENRLCPALMTRNRLKKGESLKTIIRDYADPGYQV